MADEADESKRENIQTEDGWSKIVSEENYTINVVYRSHKTSRAYTFPNVKYTTSTSRIGNQIIIAPEPELTFRTVKHFADHSGRDLDELYDPSRAGGESEEYFRMIEEMRLIIDLSKTNDLSMDGLEALVGLKRRVNKMGEEGKGIGGYGVFVPNKRKTSRVRSFLKDTEDHWNREFDVFNSPEEMIAFFTEEELSLFQKYLDKS